jgi:predicted carbohydrate-binding protein with CBM48
MKDANIPNEDRAAQNDSDDLRFVERIALPLRQPEQVDITFEARVMSAVHAEARAGSVPGARARPRLIEWWLKPRVLRTTPLIGVAAAAALIVFTLLASQTIRNFIGQQNGAVVNAGRAQTVHVVRFVLVDPTARSVSLVGDFNGWTKGVHRLDAGAGGAWVVSIPLTPGRHEYAFIVEGDEGERWVADPYAARVRDEFDTESSIIMLGNTVRRAVTTPSAS